MRPALIVSTRAARDDDSAHLALYQGSAATHPTWMHHCRVDEEIASRRPSRIYRLLPCSSKQAADDHQQRDVTTPSTTASYTANGARRPAVHTTTAPGHRVSACVRMHASTQLCPARRLLPQTASRRCLIGASRIAVLGLSKGPIAIPKTWSGRSRPTLTAWTVFNGVPSVTCGKVVNSTLDFYLSAR